MTNPKGNERVDKELSTDELKSVSGGGITDNPVFCLTKRSEGSGSGMTLRGWKKSRDGIVVDGDLEGRD